MSTREGPCVPGLMDGHRDGPTRSRYALGSPQWEPCSVRRFEGMPATFLARLAWAVGPVAPDGLLRASQDGSQRGLAVSHCALPSALSPLRGCALRSIRRGTGRS